MIVLQFSLKSALTFLGLFFITAHISYSQTATSKPDPEFIAAPDGYEDLRWGADLALKGDTLFVSAPGRRDQDHTGSVKQLIFNGAGWDIDATIESPGDTGDEFGASLDVTDSLLVVGAPYAKNEDEDTTGQAYVYIERDQNWELEHVLTDEYLHDNAEFGFSVAADSARIIVGAPGRQSVGDDPLEKVGRAYGFDLIRGLDDDGIPQSYNLNRSMPSEREQFGFAVDVHGDFAVVTSVETGLVIGPRNRAFMYKQSEINPGWGTTYADLTLDNHSWPEYGQSVALSDEYVAVGHPREQVDINDDEDTQAGSVFTYTGFVDSEGVDDPQVISPSLVRSFLEYGSGVAFYEHEIVISGRDMADIYERVDDQWELEGRMNNPNTNDVNFGGRVDFNDHMVVVSAFNHGDENGTRQKIYWQTRDEATSAPVYESEELANEVKLAHAYPNPFNPTTQIDYTLPESSEVQLEVFDITGRKVSTLIDGTQASGTHSVTFDGSELSSGVYIYRLTAGEQVLTRQMTLVK